MGATGTVRPVKIGLTYDLRDDYLTLGFSDEAAGEFAVPDTIDAVEAAPVIPLRRDELGPRAHGIFSYPFDWPDPPYVEAIALGLISLINHGLPANADWELDIPARTIRLSATRDIAAGEEITIDYGIALWFEKRCSASAGPPLTRPLYRLLVCK